MNLSPPAPAQGNTPSADPAQVRTLFDSAYGEVSQLPERAEAEVLQGLPTDIVRLFFELADEALLDPARDDPFASERKVFEMSSEALAVELERLQKLGEGALLSFRGGALGSSTIGGGQLPSILATMHVGATKVKPVAVGVRAKAAALDLGAILLIVASISMFMLWFTAPQLRSALLGAEVFALAPLAALILALLMPISVLYYLQMGGRAYGYRRQLLEVVNSKTGNPVTSRTTRLRAWLTPISLFSWLSPRRGLLWVDQLSGSTVRRNYALGLKKLG